MKRFLLSVAVLGLSFPVCAPDVFAQGPGSITVIHEDGSQDEFELGGEKPRSVVRTPPPAAEPSPAPMPEPAPIAKPPVSQEPEIQEPAPVIEPPAATPAPAPKKTEPKKAAPEKPKVAPKKAAQNKRKAPDLWAFRPPRKPVYDLEKAKQAPTQPAFITKNQAISMRQPSQTSPLRLFR